MEDNIPEGLQVLQTWFWRMSHANPSPSCVEMVMVKLRDSMLDWRSGKKKETFWISCSNALFCPECVEDPWHCERCSWDPGRHLNREPLSIAWTLNPLRSMNAKNKDTELWDIRHCKSWDLGHIVNPGALLNVETLGNPRLHMNLESLSFCVNLAILDSVDVQTKDTVILYSLGRVRLEAMDTIETLLPWTPTVETLDDIWMNVETLGNVIVVVK